MPGTWRGLLSALAAVVIGIACGTAAAQSPTPTRQPSAWAYPLLGTGVPIPTDDGSKKTLPGSKLELTITQLFDLFTAYDWFPEDHSPMPEVVSHGRKPEVRACGMCGRMAGLAGGSGVPDSSTPCTAKMFFARSIPAVTMVMISSLG